MAIAVRQEKSANGGGVSTLSVTLTSTTLAGSVVVVAAQGDSAITDMTFSDNKSDTPADSGSGLFTGNTGKSRVAAFLTTTTGAQTFTVTFSGTAPGFCEIVAWEVTGLTNASFDKHVHATGTSASASSGSTGTLASAAEIGLGYCFVGTTSNSGSIGSGWVQDEVTSPNSSMVQHIITSSTAAVTATSTLSSGTWDSWAVTLQSGAVSALPSVIGTVETVQEQPSVNTTYVHSALIPLAVAATIYNAFVPTVQETPNTPPSWARAGVPPPANFVPPSVTRNISTVQEQPDIGRANVHPLQPYVVGCVVSGFMVGREEPDTPRTWAKIGAPPGNVAPPTFTIPSRVMATRQDDIDYAFANIEISIPGPNQAWPVNVFPNIKQEAPDRPSGHVSRWSYPPTNPIGTPVPPVDQYTYITQEVPWHPQAYASGLFFPAQFTLTSLRATVTKQEYPWQPLPYKFQSIVTVIPATPVPPIDQYTYITQEIPFHPGPFIYPGPGPFAVPFVPPIVAIATYYLLEDHWIDMGGGSVQLLAGTIQSTAPGGLLPANWVPSPNVDPINGAAILAYTAAGPRRRGLIRTQWTNFPVRAPVYNWKLVNGIWLLVRGPGTPNFGSEPT